MPLIGKVGRRRFKARLALSVLYLALSLGAIVTVYPFLIMAGASVTGPTDQNLNELVPSYLTNDEILLDKYVQDKYAGKTNLIEFEKSTEVGSAETVAQYRKFLSNLDPDLWIAQFAMTASQATSRLANRYQSWLMERYGQITDLNKAYIEENLTYASVTLPLEGFEKPGWKPKAGKKWIDWLEFKSTLPAEFRLPLSSRRMYQEFLKVRTLGQFATLSASVRGSATTFETLIPQPNPDFDKAFAGLIDRVRQMEKSWSELSPSSMPIRGLDQDDLRASRGAVRQEFASRNYRYVLGYLLSNHGAFWNTVIYCGLAVLLQLIVNPMAAYALSRYPMPTTGKWLLFLLATMAFPAEVSMIPNFLMLKEMNLLNTFWALLLPSAASGYMIYLLKGFFDSLPQELFESGQIDGASEGTLLRRIAIPLSKPVLGYLSLLAFMGAYSNFIFAFLVVQDRRMWTLMVFIYQLQNFAPKSVMMAALTLAAIPTILVFLLSQRVIMRGIVLPGER